MEQGGQRCWGVVICCGIVPILPRPDVTPPSIVSCLSRLARRGHNALASARGMRLQGKRSSVTHSTPLRPALQVRRLPHLPMESGDRAEGPWPALDTERNGSAFDTRAAVGMAEELWCGACCASLRAGGRVEPVREGAERGTGAQVHRHSRDHEHHQGQAGPTSALTNDMECLMGAAIKLAGCRHASASPAVGELRRLRPRRAGGRLPAGHTRATRASTTSRATSTPTSSMSATTSGQQVRGLG